MNEKSFLDEIKNIFPVFERLSYGEKKIDENSGCFNDPKSSPKTYWSILKTFANGSKIPLMPLFLVNNKFVTGQSKPV